MPPNMTINYKAYSRPGPKETVAIGGRLKAIIPILEFVAYGCRVHGHADPQSDLDCHRPTGRSRQADAVRSGQEGGSRSDDVQQIQARDARRAAALAVNRICCQSAAGDKHQVRYFRYLDH